jgi:CDP-paratose 2-epimerase
LKILITGGAGFVGSALAHQFKETFPRATVVAFDNLHRRGGEINLDGFRRRDIGFVHGDIRVPADLEDLSGSFDVMIEASAEPSVHAGIGGSPQYVVGTNLAGTLHCLEFARRRVHHTVFLSTSRVYSIDPLRALPLRKTSSRFELHPLRSARGWSAQGIAEDFPTHLPRSIYGATKLASEMVLQEYVDSYRMKAVINRCGVIAGPGQFGKTDQGVFTLWVARHHFGLPLRYTGFGGRGLQVRDLLHPQDLYRLILLQLKKMSLCSGEVYNVGGGRPVSVSLREMTGLCREATGRSVPITSTQATADVDIPLYLSDTAKVRKAFGWKPRLDAQSIVNDIEGWIRAHEARLRPLFT